MIWLAFLLAIAVGISLGLLGGGGSIATLPILRYALGMEGHSAIATSLLVVGATSLAALLAHARKGRVQWRTGFAFGGAGMLGAYLGGSVAHRVPAPLLLGGFSLMMFATAIAMLRPERKARARVQRSSVRPSTRRGVSKFAVQGLVVGALTGLVGAGGGFLVVPTLVLLGRLPMATAIGTSLLVISLNTFAGLAGYLGHTAIDWTLGLGMSAFAIIGSGVGAWFAPRLSAQTLRQSFGWFVVAVAFFILAREVPPLLGMRAGIGVTAAASLAGTGLVALVRRLAARRPRQRASTSTRPPPAPGERLSTPLERKWS